MKVEKRKYLYNDRTYMWWLFLIFWSIIFAWMLIEIRLGFADDRDPIEGALMVLFVVIWRYVANRRKCRKPEVQAVLERKQEEQMRYEAKKAEYKRLEEINKQEVSYQRRKSNFEKKAAIAGVATGYAGLTKPYMGRKRR